jgi:hypothetical protein
MTPSALQELHDAHGGHKVSLYLPTVRAGAQTRENPIRLKNLLRAAEEELIAAGMRPTLARDLLALAHELEFVQEQHADLGDGLALFIDDRGARYYRLPIEVPEMAVVAERFELKPLMPLFSEDGTYYLLALSMNRARAFRAHRFSVHELRIPDMPHSMAAALWADQKQKQAQFHTPGPGAGGGRGTAVFHSTGDEGADRLKEDIARYFHIVDHAFTRTVEDQSPPLVLAAVDYLHPIYRSLSAYKTVLREGIDGNPDDARPEDLAAKAWPIVDAFFRTIRAADAERFGDLTGTGKASTSLPEILGAARLGRVETLWVAAGEERWGQVTEEGAVVEHQRQEPRDQDLVDLAAARTISASGRVYAVDREQVPSGGPVAAIFRY